MSSEAAECRKSWNRSRGKWSAWHQAGGSCGEANTVSSYALQSCSVGAVLFNYVPDDSREYAVILGSVVGFAFYVLASSRPSPKKANGACYTDISF